MQIKDILTLLEEWAPPAYAEDFDNTGLLIGNREEELKGVLIAHDTTVEVVREAVETGANLIISFHPIIFSGIKRLTGSDYVERTVMEALRHGVAVYALHTALDNRSDGVSGAMAEALGLENVAVLVPQKGVLKKLTVYVPRADAENLRNALFDAGAGNIGNYSRCSFNSPGTGTYLPGEAANPVIGERGVLQYEPETSVTVYYRRHLESRILKAMWEAHPYEEVAYEITGLDNVHPPTGLGVYGHLPEAVSGTEFLALVKDRFQIAALRHSPLPENTIRKVALLGGSGAFGIGAATAVGADAYVTADLKYHDFFKAGEKLLLVDAGHYETERFTKKIIHDYLTKKMSNIAAPDTRVSVRMSKIDTNPVKTYI